MADLKIYGPEITSFSTNKLIYGDCVWKDLSGNIYYMYENENYVWNKNTLSWESKSWNINTYSWNKRGSNIWNDGSTIYLSGYFQSGSYYSTSMYLSGSTWVSFDCGGTFGKGFSGLNGNYYNFSGYYLYKWDKTNKKWIRHSETNEEMSAYYVWNDGTNVFYSRGSIQKQFINEQWVDITWNGFTPKYGNNVWKCVVNGNIYYTLEDDRYTYNKATKTWTNGINIAGFSKIPSSIIGAIRGEHIWDDGTNNYYTNGGSSYLPSYKIGNDSLIIGNNVVNPSVFVSKLVGSGSSYYWVNHYWQIGSPSGPDYRHSGLNWADRSGNECKCSEYKETNTTIEDSGYVYLDDNSQRIPYTTNKNIKFAHNDGSTLSSFYPLWTTGQIENRTITTNKTRYIILNGNKRYIADSPTATSGTDLSYSSVGYKDGSGGSLTERHWVDYVPGTYNSILKYEVYVMNSTYLTYEYCRQGVTIPNGYNLASMTFTVNKTSEVVSASYTNPVLYSVDFDKSSTSTSHTYGKFNNFTLSSDGTLVLNFFTDLSYGTWYVKKIVIQVYETTVKNKW